MTRIRSIDIGSTHFGWSTLDCPTAGFYDFGLLNLKTVKGKDLPGKMHTLYIGKGFFDRRHHLGGEANAG